MKSEVLNVVEWRPEYNLGISVIDQQHQSWVLLLSSLAEAMKLEDDDIRNRIVKAVIEELVAYTTYHFDFEEKLLNQVGYVDVAQHKAEHDALRKTAEIYKKKLQHGDLPEIARVVEEMRNWLINHICIHDKRYAEFIQARPAALAMVSALSVQ